MSEKQTAIVGAIYLSVCTYEDPDRPHFMFFAGTAESFDGWACVVPHTIQFALPPNYDPRASHIKALEDAKRDLQAKFTATVTEINARISNLQAIEYSSSQDTAD